MRHKFGYIITAFALAFALSAPAAANIIVLPFTFSNGTPADANQVNSNFGTIVTLVNGSLDSTNISTILGLNPSVLKCTSGATCTITTANPLIVSGAGIEAGATPTFVPPIYTPTGSNIGGTLHGVYGTCTLAGGGPSTCTVIFSNSAIFSSASSYTCFAASQSSNQPITADIITSVAVTFSTPVAALNPIQTFCIGT